MADLNYMSVAIHSHYSSQSISIV